MRILFKHRDELVAKLMQKIRNFCVGSTKTKLRNFVKVAKKRESNNFGAKNSNGCNTLTLILLDVIAQVDLHKLLKSWQFECIDSGIVLFESDFRLENTVQRFGSQDQLTSFQVTHKLLIHNGKIPM